MGSAPKLSTNRWAPPLDLLLSRSQLDGGSDGRKRMRRTLTRKQFVRMLLTTQMSFGDKLIQNDNDAIHWVRFALRSIRSFTYSFRIAPIEDRQSPSMPSPLDTACDIFKKLETHGRHCVSPHEPNVTARLRC